MRAITICVGVLVLLVSLILSFVTASGSTDQAGTDLTGIAELAFRFRYLVNFEVPAISMMFFGGVAGVLLGMFGRIKRR